MQTTESSFGTEQLQANSETALECLAKAGSKAPELIEAWVRSANASAVSAVAERGEGAARKAARRGLNVLKSRGVSIPDAPKRAPAPTLLETGSAKLAFLLAPDGTGAQAIILAQRVDGGRYHSYGVFFNEGRGILRVEQTLSGLGKLKERMRDALAGSGYSFVEIPWSWALHRVAALRGWHRDRNVAEPLGLGNTASLFADLSAAPPPHPFDEEGFELTTEDAEELAKDSGELHQWPEFQGWLPPETLLREVLTRVGHRLDPNHADAPTELGRLLEVEIVAATDRFFTPERREQIATRMKDSALSILSTRGESAALRVAAVIQVMASAGLITNPPSTVGFLTGYLRKAAALQAARQGGQLRIPVAQPSAAPVQSSEGAAGHPTGEASSGEASAEATQG